MRQFNNLTPPILPRWDIQEHQVIQDLDVSIHSGFSSPGNLQLSSLRARTTLRFTYHLPRRPCFISNTPGDSFNYGLSIHFTSFFFLPLFHPLFHSCCFPFPFFLLASSSYTVAGLLCSWSLAGAFFGWHFSFLFHHGTAQFYLILFHFILSSPFLRGGLRSVILLKPESY